MSFWFLRNYKVKYVVIVVANADGVATKGRRGWWCWWAHSPDSNPCSNIPFSHPLSQHQPHSHSPNKQPAQTSRNVSKSRRLSVNGKLLQSSSSALLIAMITRSPGLRWIHLLSHFLLNVLNASFPTLFYRKTTYWKLFTFL